MVPFSARRIREVVADDYGGRNKAYAVIKEFPAASLRKLAYIEIIYFKAGRFIVNIGANPQIRFLLSRI
jgi:hypothetical protein